MMSEWVQAHSDNSNFVELKKSVFGGMIGMGQLMDDIVSTANHFVTNMQSVPEDYAVRGRLDFSIESLNDVDEWLGRLEQDNWDVDELYDLCSMVGCYIFETARRNYGGEYFWMENEQQPILIAGEPDFQVSIRVWQKVKGRLTNGKEDNIPFYIAGYKEHIEKGIMSKGYIVSIV